MSLLTLLLVGAICSAEGPHKICTYVDVTERMEVRTDDQCFATAQLANEGKEGKTDAVLYGCITTAQYLSLIGDTEYLKLTAIPEAM